MYYNYTKTYLYSEEFREDSNIIKLVHEYNKTPLFVIKFALLVCKEKVESAIVSVLKEHIIGHDTLIDYIISASKLKLCDNTIVGSLCNKKCICDKNISFKNLYNTLTTLIKEDPSVIEDKVFVNNYASLIQKTNVYDNSLFECIKELSYTYEETPVMIINMIVQGRLLTKKYKNILSFIVEKENKLDIKITCKRVLEMISLHNKQCTKVSPKLYISNAVYANNMSSIIDNSFNCVVSLTTKDTIVPPRNIDHHKIQISDNIYDDFISKTEDTLKIILEMIGIKKILIHCSKGQSRSVIFSALLLKYKDKIEFNEALNIVKTSREQSLPNPDIIKQINKKISNGYTPIFIK